MKISGITDYGDTMAKSLILGGPNSNPNPLFGIWIYVKAYFFVEIMVDSWKTWTRDSQYQNGC